MNLQCLSLKIEDAVAWVTIERPDALNAINKQVLVELDQVADHISAQSEIRAVVLRGSGEKAFVAGADIKEIDALNEKTSLEFAQFGQNTFLKWERLRVPTIAAVNGFALGGGFELALACDMIFATPSSKFGLPECSLGLIPGFGGTVRLSRRIGPQRAKEVALTGEFYTADQGVQLGFVNRVIPLETFNNELVRVLKVLSSRAPLALKGIKSSIDQGLHLSAEEALKLEANTFQNLFGTQDQKEGTKAFIEKRKPVFVGR